MTRTAPAPLRLFGHHLYFVPSPPYLLSRIPAGEGALPDSLRMVRRSEGELRLFELRLGQATPTAGALERLPDDTAPGWACFRLGPQGAEVRLQAGMSPRLDDDGSLLAGPATSDWTLETSLFRCAWPEGLTLASTEEGAPGPFELRGPGGSVLFFEGPLTRAQVPSLQALVLPGQELRETGELSGHPFIDVGYTHTGQTWAQRHVLLSLGGGHLLLLTAQAQPAHVPLLWEACGALVATFQARVLASSLAPAGKDGAGEKTSSGVSH